MCYKWRQNNLLLSIGKRHTAGRPYIYIPFIFVLEAAFVFIKKSKSVEDLTVFSHNFLYPAYTNNATFFLNNEKYVVGFLEFLIIFPLFSGLNPNQYRCKIVRIGALKGVHVALCGMKLDLENNTVKKKFGIHFSYNKKNMRMMSITKNL